MDANGQPYWFARLQFGSIWQVDEETWVNYIDDYRGSDRPCHPGASVQCHPPPSRYEQYPLLFGCTELPYQRRWHNVVRAQLDTRDADHWTIFGTEMQPAHIWLAEFDNQGGRATVRVWPGKSMLSESEKAALTNWCARNL